MHEREVGDVEEVLDDPRAARVDRIGAAQQLAEAGILPFGKGRHVVRRLAQADPDQAVALDRAVGLDARLARRRRVGQRRDAHALPVRAVDPAVIRALQRAAIDPAERQPRAAVHAQVLPGERLPVGLPDDDVLAQEPGAHDPARGQLVAAHDRMPVVDQHGIGDHAGALAPNQTMRPEGWRAGQPITSQKLAGSRASWPSRKAAAA